MQTLNRPSRGRSNEGDLVHFRVDEINQVVWLHKDKNEFTDFEQQLLSRNQLTLPAKIRKLFNIEPEDFIWV